MQRPSSLRAAALALLVCVIPLVSFWALGVGSAPIPLPTLWAAIWAPDGTREHLIVGAVRLPRVLAGLMVGASLAVSGAIMQAVTANPLASPGLLGVNAGAAFAVVLAMVVAGGGASTVYIGWAFAGAGIAAIAVYTLGSAGRGGATPLRLALAGAVVASFLAALTTSILIFDTATLSAVRLWTVGSLDGRQMNAVRAVAPFTVVGLALALLFRGQIMTLSLGATVAQSVGQNLMLWRGIAAAIVVLLAGGAVALAGPIGFVGLVVPHVVRLLWGGDYRWTIPFAAVIGALLVVISDNGLRALLPARDIPVGISMALIGAPFFVWLARTRIGTVR